MLSKKELIRNNENNLEITEADTKEKEKLKNLFQFYLHDLSEYTDALDVNSQGKYDNNDVNLFFDEANLIPLTIKMKKEVIGFVFLNCSKGSVVDYIINDLFILRKYRNRGIGKAVIEELFALYPGKYALLELIKNKPAIEFWHAVFQDKNIEYEEREIVSDGEDCLMQKFTVMNNNI